MADVLEVGKTIFNYSAPVLVKGIIDTWIIPKIKSTLEQRNLDNKIINFNYENAFEKYLKRSYEKVSLLNPIVFQNQQRSIKELYVPLTLQKALTDKVYKITEYNNELIPYYKKVLIADNAGMGKSTILKWLFISCIEKNQGIPIYIELRKLSKEKTILREILRELSSINEDIDKDFVTALINKGDFIFFFDGFDEIPLIEKEFVNEDIEEFISKASNNYFIMASRQEEALASFGSFQKFNIVPLKSEEAFQLIAKYSINKGISEKLIEDIKEPDTFNAIEEFLTNPMMVSLLYKGYEYKPVIPYKKHIFYRNVYDALFESHDLTKGTSFIRKKYTGLDIEEFHQILRMLGFITSKLIKIEYEKDEILNLIRKSKYNCPNVNFKESDLLKDLILTVPLFQKDGVYYKWAHKSIQDYFAAQHICIDTKGEQDNIFRSIRFNSIFYNIMDLCWAMDFKAFRRTIVYDFAKKFVKFCNTTFQNVDKDINEQDIRIRQGIIFKLQEFQNISHGFILTQTLIREFEKSKNSLSFVKNVLSSETIIPYKNTVSIKKRNGLAAMFFYDNVDRNFGNLFTKYAVTLVFRKVHSSNNENSNQFPDIGYIPLNDNPSALVNSKEYFQEINDLFLDNKIGSHGMLIPDYEKCIELVRNIEKEQQECERDSLYQF